MSPPPRLCRGRPTCPGTHTTWRTRVGGAIGIRIKRRSLVCTRASGAELPQRKRGPRGFELFSDFGWTIQITLCESDSPLPIRLEDQKGKKIQSSMIQKNFRRQPAWLEVSSDDLDVDGVDVIATEKMKKIRSRRFSKSFKIPPHWKWPALYLLEALLLSARRDPSASAALALDIHESDGMLEREMQQLREGFLRHASSNGIRICKMAIEAKEMRNHLGMMRKEMEEEENRIQHLCNKSRRLQCEILECICADRLLENLNVGWKMTHAKTEKFILKKRPAKKLVKRF